MHLNGIFFEKFIFWILLKQVIILTWYIKTNEKMAINKFQRSMLTSALSATVAHIAVPSIH